MTEGVREIEMKEDRERPVCWDLLLCVWPSELGTDLIAYGMVEER